MAVSLVAAAAAQNAGVTTPAGTAAITPTTTAVTLATHPVQRVFVYQSHSCETGSAATPTDWTALYKDVVVGTGTASAAAGRRFISCYYRDWDGVWSMPSFDLASATQNSHAIATLTVTCDPTETFDTPTFSGDGEYFGTAGTAFSAATPAAFNAVTKAFLMAHAVTNDNVTATTGAITGSGFTSGTVTERADGGTATGNDVSIKLHTCSPTTGANVALTHTMTLSAASQGGWAAVQQTATYGGSTPSGAFVYDTMRDADGVNLTAHTPEVGGTWSAQTGGSGSSLFHQNRIYGTGDFLAVASATPPSADYDVEVAIRILSAPAGGGGGCVARGVAGVATFYYCYMQSNNSVVLSRFLNGAFAELSRTTVTAVSVGSVHTLMLRVNGNQISVYYDGALTVGPVTNSEIAAAGKAGCITASWTTTTGRHIESVTATPYPNATDFVKDYTDLVGITDSLTKDVAQSATDAVGITDSATFVLGYSASATDPVGVTDSLAKEAGKTATDLVGVTDSAAVQQDWVRSQTDAVGITDSGTFGQDYLASATDPVGITDSASVVQGLDRPTTDLVGVTDSITASRGYNSPATDLVGITDSATFGLGFSASATDLVGVTDSATFSRGYFVAATDPVGVTDSISVQQDWARSQTDLVGITDTSVKDSGRTTTDLVGITDSAAVQQDRLVSATDPVGLLDSVTIEAGRTATDAVGVTDAASVQQNWSRTQTDLVGITDSSIWGPGRLATDLVGITDSLSQTQAWVRSQTDLVGVTDSSSFDLAGAGNFTGTDQVGVTDTLNTAFAAVRLLADLVGITDSALFQVGFAVGKVDPVGVTDALSVITGYERSWTDPVGVADSASFNSSSAGDIAKTDLVGVADSTSIIAGYVRSFTDPVGVVDSASFTIVSAGSIGASDLVGLSDSAAFQLGYIRSLTDPVGVADDAEFSLASDSLVSFSDDVGVTDVASFTLGDAVWSATDLVGVTDTVRFVLRPPPGPDNSWVPRSESVVHTALTESAWHTGPGEFGRYAIKQEYNTDAARAEATHLEVVG